jgi:hypothetical protein
MTGRIGSRGQFASTGQFVSTPSQALDDKLVMPRPHVWMIARETRCPLVAVGADYSFPGRCGSSSPPITEFASYLCSMLEH